MNEKRNVTLRDALLKALAVATFTAVSATAFTPVAQARVLLDEVNDDVCDLGDDDTGDGSAADPFRISTVEDLAEVGDCDYVDGDFYYSLENDLDISPDDNFNNDDVDWNTTDGGWEPIGEYHGESFNGEFDGNGHTISGLEIDNSVRSDSFVGLFSETEDAVIKDLNIVGVIDADDYDSVGLLAGRDFDSQISNVHIDADITDGGDYVGGLLGLAGGSRMSNITTTGDVVTNDESTYTGGIVGYNVSSDYEPSIIDSSSDVTINDANITDNYNDYVGGIAGYADNLRLVRVSFDGTVTGTDRVGGLVGALSEGLIHDSVVTEDAKVVISDEEYADQVGGLVGELDGSTISGSSFHGTLDAYLDSYDIQSLGGIVGNADYSYLVNVYVGSTALLELAGGGDSSYYVGGIAGYADETAISGAAMNADLTVLNANAVGGLVGAMSDSQLDSSVNRGNVSVTLDSTSFSDDSAQVGGLVGAGYDGASVTNSTNKGDVALDTDEGTYGVGGIIGVGNEVLVTDNYNTGDVSGIYNIAGVVGLLTDQGAVVQRNYSVGTLTASDSNPDGIATLRGPDADPTDGPYFDEPSNVVLLSDGAENETGAEEMTAVRLKTESELVALGWLVNDADRADWTIDADFNDGFPHLAWETVSEDIDEEIGLLDFTFQEIVTFLGGKRKMLRTYERNALNEVVDFVTVNAYDTVEVHVYYGTKVKLAQKRGLNVKRWLVRQGVAQPITVFVHSADNSNPIGSVTIEALVD